MRRDKTEDVLLKMGIPVGLKGFGYIVDAMEFFEEEGTNVAIINGLYGSIATRRKSTKSRVERAIRYALDTARKSRGHRHTVAHYIGRNNPKNSHALKYLYMMLKRKEDD